MSGVGLKRFFKKVNKCLHLKFSKYEFQNDLCDNKSLISEEQEQTNLLQLQLC